MKAEGYKIAFVKFKFFLNNIDKRVLELVRETDKKILAIWAIDCVERIMPFFEQRYPEDHRPRNAITTLKAWILTGVFRMAEIRGASLSSHASAREVGEDNSARSAARAAGQAVATAHVRTHSIGAAQYVLQAIYRANDPEDANEAIEKEKEWQYQHLIQLRERMK